MLWDWWPQEVSEKLQQFYKDLKDGKRPKVAIMAPPQHGKSTAATDFITWVAGQDPLQRRGVPLLLIEHSLDDAEIESPPTQSE